MEGLPIVLSPSPSANDTSDSLIAVPQLHHMVACLESLIFFIFLIYFIGHNLAQFLCLFVMLEVSQIGLQTVRSIKISVVVRPMDDACFG